MITHLDHNYLRMYRRRAGLTQTELAYLVGFCNKALVSRIEKCTRIPTLQTALACEAALGVPLAELFAGLHYTVNHDLRKRELQLRSKLQRKQSKGGEAQFDAHKLRWLDARLAAQSPDGKVALP